MSGSDAVIAVVDYHKGNLLSVQRGLADAGVQAVITDDPAVIAGADGVVLPGVGAFADASATMLELGQMQAVRDAVSGGAPFLGICLGLQLAFERGDEGCEPGGFAEGLGFLKGRCVRLGAERPDGTLVKVPHVGWNDIELTEQGAENPLFAGVPSGTYFYFTHSYCAVPDDDRDVLANTVHAEAFPSAVAQGNVYGCQFHPEKSSAWGLAVLKNFVRIVTSAKEARA